MEKQSEVEIFRIIKDWIVLYAPKTLRQDDQTMALLANWVLENDGGVASFSGLNKAAEELGDQILVPQPKPKSQEQLAREFEERERQRIEKERLDNSKPFDVEGRTRAVENAKKEEQRQKTAQAQIENIIANYSVNAGPGRIDATKSAEGQKALRGIRLHINGKYDAPTTLKVVQQSYNFDTPKEIIQAAEAATIALGVTPNRREEEQKRWNQRPR